MRNPFGTGANREVRECSRWVGRGKGRVATAVLLPTADGGRVRGFVNSVYGPEGRASKLNLFVLTVGGKK